MTNVEENQKSYIVCGSKPWNRHIFNTKLVKYPGNWLFIDSPTQLIIEEIKEVNPRYIFFLHWSWKVPNDLIENHECVCFHMTDVPYGRGGTPLQNLIVRGHRETKLTALRMSEEFDAGPVYLKEPLSLEGNAEEIYIRSTNLSSKMIKRMVEEEPQPLPQEGEVVIFKRRKPEESEIRELASLSNLHDFIRMLDAQGYPKAFINYKDFHFEFSRAALYEGQIIADVKITLKEDKEL
ncbi:MAG: methionyl-tRNA formyltransferase [Okeania sp. SIO3I5]|uniref:hypothetical protein n=1 Tax=Okeania sp. SIO3I5 TaxID=2607805 RepID=UPI0013B84C93|nr:hypothetical protein [Okeania sp. SIO3I5]NEQ36719.1 methionyl-tRNA formyltransferase [Okeania sp. SIO3I5]